MIKVVHIVWQHAACNAFDYMSLPLDDHWSHCLENFDSTNWNIIEKIDPEIIFFNTLVWVVMTPSTMIVVI